MNVEIVDPAWEISNVIRQLLTQPSSNEPTWTAFQKALEVDSNDASTDLARLTGLHVVEADFGNFSVSPPLQIAVERDGRLVISSSKRTKAIQRLARSLTMRIEDGTPSIFETRRLQA